MGSGGSMSTSYPEVESIDFAVPVSKGDRNKSKKSGIDFQLEAGRFLIKTVTDAKELRHAFSLRYKVFQVEMIGHQESESGEDTDVFDEFADHLAIFDKTTNQMIATCRLISSQFSKRFYSEQEFECQTFLSRPEVKLEIGRVCVHPEFRRSIVIMLLWRGIAEYMIRSKAEILFGCGSILTLDPVESLNLYLYLKSQGKLAENYRIEPTEKYRSQEFDRILLHRPNRDLSQTEQKHSMGLIPPLCRSYFDIGCSVAGPPAFDREFKCIDFLTILEVKNLSPRVRQRMFGAQL
jgi:putative hemolysin